MKGDIKTLKKLCFECETLDCAYNHDGDCRFPLVHERLPIITEEDGCREGVIDLTGSI